MWVLLSSRLRAWALFAVAVPIVRFFLHRFSQSAQDTRPGTAIDSGADPSRLDAGVVRQPPLASQGE